MTESAIRPFHLAIPIRDVEESRLFYGQLLGLSEGRSSEEWIDWNLYGHQLVTHLKPQLRSTRQSVCACEWGRWQRRASAAFWRGAYPGRLATPSPKAGWQSGIYNRATHTL